MAEYATSLDGIPMPDRIRALPVCPTRNVPVPWFVVWIDGKPEFRVADADKRVLAVTEKLCWVCGQKLGAFLSFVIGPMCSVNRISSEPPSHRECAEFSVRACPFLSKPHMVRRENNLPEDKRHDGRMIARNPGCAAVWTTKSYKVVSDGAGGWLVQIGDPTDVTWWAEGRTATRDEVLASIDSGLPLLRDTFPVTDTAALLELGRLATAAMKYLPAAEVAAEVAR